MKILGIDPGLGGGLALLDGDGLDLGVWDMPSYRTGKGTQRDYDLRACWDVLGEVRPDVVVVEKLQPTLKVSKHTCMSLGGAEMLWRMAAVAGGIRVERLSPKRWQQVVDCQAGERAALARARELFPNAMLPLAKHSGRAAALLIAEAARRTLGGWKENAA